MLNGNACGAFDISDPTHLCFNEEIYMATGLGKRCIEVYPLLWDTNLISNG